MLGKEIENDTVLEFIFRVRRRIDHAHVYDAYKMAQANPDAFLQCAEKMISDKDVLPPRISRSKTKSKIKDRFADLLFLELARGDQVTIASNQQVKETISRKVANQRVEDWSQNGKRWSEVIQHLGYGILLLISCKLSDKRYVSNELATTRCLPLLSASI